MILRPSDSQKKILTGPVDVSGYSLVSLETEGVKSDWAIQEGLL